MFATLALQVMVVSYPAPRPPEGPDKGPGYLGITFSPANNGGVLISEVREKSPAQMSGLRVNDVIMKYDGADVGDTNRFIKTIVRTRPGTVVPVEILREEKRMTLKVKMGARPDDFPFPLPELDDAPDAISPGTKEVIPPPKKERRMPGPGPT